MLVEALYLYLFFMYWFPEWSPSMIVGTSLFSVMCNAISGSIAYLKQKKVYISAALVFSVATFPGAILGLKCRGGSLVKALCLPLVALCSVRPS